MSNLVNDELEENLYEMFIEAGYTEKEAEKAVLGSIILEPTLWDSLSIEIEENDFIAPEHRLIFRGIKKLVDLGSQIDTVTLIESLSNDSELSSLSNFDKVAYVKKLVSETPGTANFANYTNIIKQSSSLRKLISLTLPFAIE